MEGWFVKKKNSCSKRKVPSFSAGYSLFAFDPLSGIKGDLEVFHQSRSTVCFDFSSVFLKY